MKNIQVIDGADNCAYDIFSINKRDFKLIFSDADQDIEFIDDFVERVGESVAQKILSEMWKHIVDKKEAQGIQGTLFYELDIKKKFYPRKMEADLDQNPGHSYID